jgi:hypothetical protein
MEVFLVTYTCFNLNLEIFAKTQEKQQYHNLTLRMTKREIRENFRDAAVGWREVRESIERLRNFLNCKCFRPLLITIWVVQKNRTAINKSEIDKLSEVDNYPGRNVRQSLVIARESK